MGYGRTTPRGCLAVYAVGTEEEAKALVVLTCKMAEAGVYYAPELAEAQTLENLETFSARLDKAHDIIQQHGRCTCEEPVTRW